MEEVAGNMIFLCHVYLELPWCPKIAQQCNVILLLIGTNIVCYMDCLPLPPCLAISRIIFGADIGNVMSPDQLLL